jgi:hypothetical protein
MLRSSTPWFSMIFEPSNPCVHGAYCSFYVYGGQARPTRAEQDCCVGQAADTPGAGGTVPGWWVAYLRAADNVSGPLPHLAAWLHQPTISPLPCVFKPLSIPIDLPLSTRWLLSSQ